MPSRKRLYKELFEKIDKEKKEKVTLGETVMYLREINAELEENDKVKFLLDQFESSGESVLSFSMFCSIMEDLEDMGWKKAAEKKKESVIEREVRAVFNLVDMDKSGAVSRREAQMACNLLKKRFGIQDVGDWMRQVDDNDDGDLSFEEFSDAVLDLITAEHQQPEEAPEDNQE